MSRLDPLRHLANRASQPPHDTFFVGGALLAWRTAHDLTEADLAVHLGCEVEALVNLALCRRPEPGADSYQADVDKIAERFGVDAGKLAQLLAEVARRGRQKREAK